MHRNSAPTGSDPRSVPVESPARARLSVVIPARNAAATLAAQLEALAAQPHEHLHEVLLVDDGSSDATRTIFAAHAARLPRARVVEGAGGRGASRARNLGAAHAAAGALAFCDADDIVGPGWLDALSASLARGPLATGPLLLDRLNPPWLAGARSGTHEAADHAPPTAGWHPFAIGANLGVRREVFLELGGFDEALLATEDMDFSWRARLAGHALEFNPDAVVHYRLRGSLWTSFRQAWFYGRWYVLLARKHAAAGYRAEAWSPRRVARGWRRTLALVPAACRDRSARVRFCFETGTHLGRLEGSIRHRHFVP